MKNNLIGRRYERLTVIGYSHTAKKRHYWECRCDCGTVKVIDQSSFTRTSNNVKSCGCWRSERIATANFKHGMYRTRMNYIWNSMVSRCTNSNDHNFHNYGGRGITVCDRWREFANFYEDMSSSYEDHKVVHGEKQTTIERIDNDGNYEPGNCTWATWSEQAKNKRPRARTLTGRFA